MSPMIQYDTVGSDERALSDSTHRHNINTYVSQIDTKNADGTNGDDDPLDTPDSDDE